MTALAWIAALGAAIIVYHRLGESAQKPWLLLLSYAFYAFWAWPFLPVLLLQTLATHAIATRIATRPTPADERETRRRRRWLVAGVLSNVAALAALRYGYRSTPFDTPFAVLGISFYSLQALAFLFDTYSGALRTSPTRTDFALYLAYFPKIVAGPIEGPQAFLRQLEQARSVDDARLARAATLIALGLTRKLLIADPLSPLLPAAAFSAPSGLDGLALATAVIGFMFVLYNDFAGYTNIARGISCLFGIELSRNFAVPFAAHSFSDLWSRWHITFSHWLRDYIYLPLSRVLLRRRLSRGNLANLFLPPIATMLVCGLWHGSSVHVLLWGGLHGVYLVIERIVALRWPPTPHVSPPAWRRVAGIVLVFTLSSWALVLLRLPLEQALPFWRQLFMGPVGALPDYRIFLFVLFSLWLDWMQTRHGDDALITHWSRAARVAALATALLLWLAMWGALAPSPFVYQGF